MEAILKTFILANDPKKWTLYENDFRSFYEKQNKNYDRVLEYIQWYFSKTKTVPTWGIIHAHLVSEEYTSAIEYTTKIVEDATIALFPDITEFAAWLKITKTKTVRYEVNKEINNLTSKISESDRKSEDDLFAATNEFRVSVSNLYTRANKNSSSIYGMTYGPENRELELIYEKRLKEILDGYKSYYPIGIDGMESIKPKLGDLVVIGGFVSHGKSIWLRHLTYHYAINLSLNVAFFTFEMDYVSVRQLFSLLHSNNKKIFPNNPKITFESFVTGKLDTEQRKALLDIAEPDLLNNPRYGTIHIEQPKSSRYTLQDMEARLQEIENLMLISVVIVDYLTLLYPLPATSRQQPSVNDYNQLFKDFKNILLTHKNYSGTQVGLLGITGAQISRHGFEAAVKCDGIYDISAFSHYSEIERSADILLTSYAPDTLKNNSRIRLQALKNRNGSVPQCAIDLDCAYTRAFVLNEIDEHNNTYNPYEIDSFINI